MNCYNYARYMRYLLHRRKPRLVILDITSRCNAKCPFCPRTMMPKDRKNGIMSKELFEDILSELKKEGIRNIRRYSTGEPLLHPDIDYMIRRLHESGMHITVSTNASELDKHHASLLLVDHVQLSISGWDKESYELLHFPLKYEETKQKVRVFHKIVSQVTEGRPKISINMIQTKKTDLKKFYETWIGLTDSMTINPLVGTTLFNGWRFIGEQMPGIEEYYMPYRVDHHRGCEYPFDILTIAYDGKISLCCADYSARLPLGDIRDGLMNAFNSVEMQKIRKGFINDVPSVCQGCSRFFKSTGEL